MLASDEMNLNYVVVSDRAYVSRHTYAHKPHVPRPIHIFSGLPRSLPISLPISIGNVCKN